MQQNPNDLNERNTSGTTRSGTPGAGANAGNTGAESRTGSDRLGADLGDTTGDRSASAFSDTSGTLGRESRGGMQSGSAGETAGEAQGTLDELGDQAKEKLGEAKEKVRNFRVTLADKLDAGAEKLRQRSAKTSVAEVGAEAEQGMRKTGSKLASGMENTADWLRNNDVGSLKTGIENQVRAKPGRTLLVALGLGYVVGRVLRGRER